MKATSRNVRESSSLSLSVLNLVWRNSSKIDTPVCVCSTYGWFYCTHCRRQYVEIEFPAAMSSCELTTVKSREHWESWIHCCVRAEQPVTSWKLLCPVQEERDQQSHEAWARNGSSADKTYRSEEAAESQCYTEWQENIAGSSDRKSKAPSSPHQQQCRSNVRLCCHKRQQCRTILL